MMHTKGNKYKGIYMSPGSIVMRHFSCEASNDIVSSSAHSRILSAEAGSRSGQQKRAVVYQERSAVGNVVDGAAKDVYDDRKEQICGTLF